MTNGEREAIKACQFHDITEGDVAFALELADAYRRDARSSIDGLIRSLAENDRETGKKKAHALKGSSANIGAAPLRDLAVEMEAALEAGAWRDVDILLAGIQREFDRADKALRALTDSMPS
ncbi:MAG: hypothetical protein AMXMBFR84_40940 [Candidatus Hydrogenedentota bacterium]